MSKIQQRQADFLNARNSYYMKLAEPKTKQLADGDSPPPAKKKNVSALKTEQLQRMFSDNARHSGGRFGSSAVTSQYDMSGRSSIFGSHQGSTNAQHALINGRELRLADPKFQRKIGKMHYAKSPKEHTQATGHDTDEDTFDKDLAAVLMRSDNMKQGLNPLFMDTRKFNMTSVEHGAAE